MLWLLQITKLGLKSLALHKLRSALTALGIIFGVSSVIAMLSIGEGASIQESSIEDSVILENCHVSGVGHITASIVGRSTTLIGSTRPGVSSLFVSDDSCIEI